MTNDNDIPLDSLSTALYLIAIITAIALSTLYILYVYTTNDINIINLTTNNSSTHMPFTTPNTFRP